jgi:hypothetical protein
MVKYEEGSVYERGLKGTLAGGMFLSNSMTDCELD